MANMNQPPAAGQTKQITVAFIITLVLLVLVMLVLAFGPHATVLFWGQSEPATSAIIVEGTGGQTDNVITASSVPGAPDLSLNPELQSLERWRTMVAEESALRENPELKVLDYYVAPKVPADLYTNPELKVLDYPQRESGQ